MKLVTKPKPKLGTLNDGRWYPPVAKRKAPESVLVCAECYEPVELKGEDALSWCESCQQLEGETFEVGPAGDDCDCSYGDDGATPTRCRQCDIRSGWGE